MRWLACVNLRDEEAEHVVESAGRWAERASATVDLLFVDEVPAVPVWVTDPLSAQVLATRWEEVRKEEEARLASLLERVPDAARGRGERVEGRAPEEIARRAAAYDAIVLAGRRHTAIGRVLVGSVAARVLRICPVPVLVLPPGRVCAPPEGRIRALFGVDLRAADAGTGLDDARAWAARWSAILDLVHVDNARLHVPYILDEEVRARFDREWQALRQRDLRALEELLATVPLEGRGVPRVEEGDAGAALAELSAEYDVVLVATHGRTGLDRWMIGSVAEKVVQAVDRPVLLLRAGRAP